MANYQSYPEYKHSNVIWLEDIPTHWPISLFKRHCDIQLGKMLQPQPNSTEDIEVPYLKAVHVQWEKVQCTELPTMWASRREIEKFHVKNGDLLVCEGGEVGRTAILYDVDGICIIQNALHRICGNSETFVPFLNYLMRHIADAKWFDILCNKATIAHLTGEKLGALGLPLPPIPEQKTIARFLDYKTAQIDALIAKKEALLAKLAEKRTALISHAVTKGLDPSVPMKDSGVEWLGDIPAHWKSISVRWLIRIGSGDFISNTETEFDYSDDFPTPVIGGNGIMSYTDRNNTPKNCIVIGRVGAHCGNVHYIKEASWVTDNALRIRIISSEITAEFLLCALKALGLNDFANKNAQPLITGEMVKNKKIALPPIEEQIRICNHVNTVECYVEK